MATRFLRLDLSETARDYETIALRPGLALLDREGVNYRVLNKRLGQLIGEPQWAVGEVSFFVSDESGARHHNIQCEPATPKDLKSVRTLREDLESIKQKLQDTTTASRDATTLSAALDHFNHCVKSDEVGSHFFRYRDSDGKWRLVWCWGYQRRQQAPATPKICTNPQCRQLFLRRPDGPRDCPGCVCVSDDKSKFPKLAAAVLLILILGAAAFLAIRRFQPGRTEPSAATTRLVVDLADWQTPVGSQRSYRVVRTMDNSDSEEDVSSRVVCVSDDPTVARFEKGTTTLIARSRGKTSVHFFLGEQVANATIEVEAPRNPKSIRLEPQQVTLGIGSTERLVLLGDFGDGQSVDLTAMALWEPVDGASVSCTSGRLEGVSAGQASVVARYQATADDPLISAEAQIEVVDEAYSRLEIRLDPTVVEEGSCAKIAVLLVDSRGVEQSALGASQLSIQVDDPILARIQGDLLCANHVGEGTVTAKFQDLTAEATFTVNPDLEGRFVVSPRELQLFVGEVVELDVVSGSAEAIHVTSSDPKVVDVESGIAVVGKSPGTATLIVSQEARQSKIEVEVKAPDLKSLAFVPARMSVPVDRRVPVRLVGLTKDDERFDLSPEAVTWERIPEASVAELDVERLQVLGRTPTDVPEKLTARCGMVRADGQIDVVAAPLKIELSPAGPVPLRKGQSVLIHAFVRYGDGTRAEIDPNRISWQVNPEDQEKMSFDRAKAAVSALEDGGSLSIAANYGGYISNRVNFNAVNDSFTLQLESDRSVFLVGDRGRFRASIQGAPAGTSLVGARFESRDPRVLTIDRLTGRYHAVAPGKVFVGVSHETAVNAAVESIEIIPRSEAKLVIRPESVNLLVNARQSVDVILISDAREESVSLLSPIRPYVVSIGQPDAVRWQPPTLTGMKPADPFEIAVEYEDKVARALVHVIEEGGDLRVVPDRTRLSAGQDVSPIVQQNVPGTDEWLEIEPDKIRWEVPDGLRWTPVQGSLRPRVSPAPTAQGSLALVAHYQDKTAQLQLEVANDTPPRGELEVVRDPNKEELPVGDRQQFTIIVKNGDARVPAANVQWQEPFENDYVHWDPPILISKRGGHVQHLDASVDGQRVGFAVRTVAEPDPVMETPPLLSEKPTAVRLVSDQGEPITLPVGSQFSAFRVEADYSSRTGVDVTPFSLFRTSPGPELTFAGGSVWGRSAGTATLSAVVQGVETTDPLSFNVVDDVELNEIEVSPQRLQLKQGESATLHVTGFFRQGEERRSVGEVAALKNVQFRSDHPEVVRADGATLTGVATGSASVSIQAAGAEAAVAVDVVPDDADYDQPLVVSPQTMRLKVGESKLIGRDVVVRRGDLDLSDQVAGHSSDPLVARFDDLDRSVIGVSAGRASLSLHVSGQSTELSILVVPADQEGDGELIIEPETSSIAVGETVSLRAILVDRDGQRVDRTSSAVFVVQDSQIVGLQRNQLTGLTPGSSSVAARIAGNNQIGRAQVDVVDDEFTSLEVSPSRMRLGLGQVDTLQIQAIGPSGRRSLGDHPDLNIEVSGSNPNAVNVSGNRTVLGAAPGEATLQIRWKDLEAQPVEVQVVEQPITSLRLVPQQTRVEVNGTEPIQVLAQRGGSEVPLTVADGLILAVDDPAVAEVNDQAVRGIQQGVTVVTARIGSHRAAGNVTVVPDSGRDRASDMPVGLRFIPDVLRLQLGVPGGSVRLVKVSQGGTVEDLDHRADFEITSQEGQEVVAVRWTASGPVFVAKKVGQADVIATAGDLKTQRPLRVVVVDPSEQPNSARLQVQPNPLHIQVGQRGEFERVTLDPGDGTQFNVDYSITSNNNSVVSAEGKQLRAVATGQARVTVRPEGVSPELSEVSTDVTVIVDAAAPATPPNASLALRGPSRGTIGEPLQFRVVLEGDASEQDVTHEGASLVLSNDQAALAKTDSGCVLIPAKAGILRVKARYKDQISNTLSVAIDPPAEAFTKLQLEIDSKPMSVGERRPYKLTGYPSSGGAPQDLTHLIGKEDGAQIGVSARPGNQIFSHESPHLIAISPGTIQIGAQCRGLRSEIVEIEVLEDEVNNLRLRVETDQVTIRVNERTPQIRVFAESPTTQPKTVEAVWSSADESIAEPDPEAKGRFVGRQVGQTNLTATFGDQTASVVIRVVSDPLNKVSISEKPNFQPGNRFNVTVVIQPTLAAEESFEYRVSPIGDPSTGQWTVGSGSRFELSSPWLKRGPDETTYNLTIEARQPGGSVVARYPLSFSLDSRINPTTEVQE